MTNNIHRTEKDYQLDRIDDHIAGDSIILGPFTVEESDGSTRDLTNDTLEWYLFDNKYDNDTSKAILSHTDTGVTIEEPPNSSYTDGKFQVFVEQDVTTDFNGEKWQRPVIDAVDASKQTWKGPIEIEQ